MSTLEALLLGFIQGITEFLPVSSSGHLQLAQRLFGFQHLEQYILFNLVCHLGTLCALLYGFRSEIKQLFQNKRGELFQILLAIIPLFPLLLILKPIKAFFDHPSALGYCFMITALFLYIGIRFGKPKSTEKMEKSRWKDALLIGVSQACAILPGISRSGSTISAARLLGWPLQKAVSFSFLLSIPTLIGGMIIEGRHLFEKGSTLATVSLNQYFIGFFSSFLVGCFGFFLLMKVASKDKFIYFVWYCLIIGILTLIYTGL